MLERNGLHVWRVDLDSAARDEARVASWSRLLSQEEQRKAAAFHLDGHRREYIVAHAALRELLGRSLGVEPAAVCLTVRPPEVGGGAGAAPTKPSVVRAEGGAGSVLDLRFNLSHTAGVALIALTVGREVGVDVERNRPLKEMEAMVHSVFSEEEMRMWLQLPAIERFAAFYRVWTRKEAYLKAIGLGLYRLLRDVTVPVSVERIAGASQGRPVRDLAGKGTWQVADVEVESGYSAAVCWEGEGLEEVVVTDLDLAELN